MAITIVLFDGVCNLCQASVMFIIKRDPQKQFQFASLQSAIGKRLLAEHGIDEEQHLHSMVLIKDGVAYRRSSAALCIARMLGGLWPMSYGFIIIPRPIRDLVYNFIGKRRYQWFGKRGECWIPSENLRDRFLD